MRSKYPVALLILLCVVLTSEAQITEIIDLWDPQSLYGPQEIALDSQGNAYVVGNGSHNVFMIELDLFSDGFESSNTSAWSE